MIKLTESIKSFRDILNNKNVLRLRNNIEIQNLTRLYMAHNDNNLYDLITNINILNYRNADEQMLLINTYLKHPFPEIKKVILDYDLLFNCDIHSQLNVIYSFVYNIDKNTKNYCYSKEGK